MKKWVKWLVLIVGMIGIVVMLGVKDYMDQQAEIRREMVRIAKSEEAEVIFKKEIESLDPKAFTAEGVIQSYKVDYDSLDPNPMGGFFILLIINEDKELYISMDLMYEYGTQKLITPGMSYSRKLDDLLRGEFR